MNHEFRRLESVVLDVSPRLITDRSIRLPVEGSNIPELTSFHVKHRGVLLHGIVLVIDDAYVVAMMERVVVIEGRKLSEVIPQPRLADPPVEVHNVRMIFLDNLG